MLHLEQYLPGTREHAHWELDSPKPESLVNPRQLLEKIIKPTSYQYDDIC